MKDLIMDLISSYREAMYWKMALECPYSLILCSKMKNYIKTHSNLIQIGSLIQIVEEFTFSLLDFKEEEFVLVAI